MTTLARWSAVNVKVGDVVEALESLRHEDAKTATRTSVATLIITVQSIAETDRALQTIEHMSSRSPVRSIVLVVEPDTRDERNELDALVRLHGSSAGGHAFWSDTVVLTVRGPAVDHLDSIAEPLVLPDLPVVVWFLATVPGPDDPLVSIADDVVVDTKELGAVFALAAIAEVCTRRTVVDLSWVRLRPWRILLADMFEHPEARPFIHHVRHVEVAGKSAPRLLLSGWLASRLQLPRSAIHCVDDRHVRITLQCTFDGKDGKFVVERPEGERFVRAAYSIQDGRSGEEILALPDDSLPWSLAEALTHLEPSHVYEEALTSAVEFD